MSRSFEYWFDFSCPYAYLASTQVEALAARTGATLLPKPCLLGGVFKALDTPQKLFATMGPEKAKHGANDLRRFSNLFQARNADRELTREIASHLVLLQDDFERRGFSPQDAAVAARQAYGGVDLVKELK